MLHNPSPPLVEGDVLSKENAPEDEAPDQDDGEGEDERVEPDFTEERNLDPHPGAVVLFEVTVGPLIC